MSSDPEGNFCFLAIGISIGISLLFEGIEDLANDGKLFNGDINFGDYLGAGISGLLGGLGGGIGAQLVFSVAGGIADAWISGDLAENGLGSTMLNIGVSTLFSGSAGVAGNKISSALKGKSLSKLGRHVIKSELAEMGLKYSLTKNRTSAKAITKFLANEGNNWFGKIVSEYGASGITSGLIGFINF